MPHVFHDGGREAAGYRGRPGDCVTRALAIVTGKPYREIYDAINAQAQRERPRKGRSRSSSRTGVRKPTTMKVMVAHGGVWTPTMFIGSGTRVHLRADELPSGRIVASVSKHVCAVIDGIVYDTHDPSREGTRAVYGYWTFPDLSEDVE